MSNYVERGLHPDLPAHLNRGMVQELVTTLGMYQERFPVFEHVYTDNPVLEKMMRGAVEDFDTEDPRDGKKVVFYLAGPLASGKSTLARGLARKLEDAVSLRFDETTRPIVLVDDWGESRKIGQSMPGGVTRPVGALRSSDYETMRAVDDDKFSTFLSLGQRILLVKEIVGVGQNFGVQGEVMGDSRGDIGDIRTYVGNGLKAYMGFVATTEEERAQRLLHREARGDDSGNSGSNYVQHRMMVAEIVSRLIINGELMHFPDHFAGVSSVMAYFKEDPEAMLATLQCDLAPRIGGEIFKGKHTKRKPRWGFLKNSDLPEYETPEDEQEQTKNLLEEKSLLNEFRREAARTGNARITGLFKRYGLSL